MFLKLGAIGAVFSIIATAQASADDLTLPDAPQITQSAGLDEPIRQIADTPAGCEVLDKDFPGLRQHAMYDFFKSMSLNQIAALSKGQITQEMLAQAQTDILALHATDAQAGSATPISTTPVSATPVNTTTIAATEP